MATSKQVKELAQKMVDAIVGNKFFSQVTNEYSHIERHVHDDRTETLDRVLANDGNTDKKKRSNKETRNMNSSFMSIDKAYENIEECIIAKGNSIAEWLLEEHETRKHEKKEFVIELPPEDYDDVGYGYVINKKDNTISECMTNSIKVILQRTDENNFGFNILTAYPDIVREENRKLTGRDLTEDVKNTNTYKNASPAAKAYMLYQTSQTSSNLPYLVTFKAGNHGDSHDDVTTIHMPYNTDNGSQWKHMIRIKEDSIELSTSKLVDVNVAEWIDKKGHKKSRTIQPDEDISKYQKPGTDIVKDKKYIKQKSFFTRHFGCTDDKSLVVDLTRPSVFTEFKLKYPKVADAVNDIWKQMGNSGLSTIDLSKRKSKKFEKAEELNESLLQEKSDKETGIDFV